jgi:hypothetical protein
MAFKATVAVGEIRPDRGHEVLYAEQVGVQFHVENGDAVMAGQPLYDIEIRAAPMAISKIFVANHDEIAVRIIRGPRLGIQTVQAVVAADGGMLPAPHTDETVPVGRARSLLASCHK